MMKKSVNQCAKKTTTTTDPHPPPRICMIQSRPRVFTFHSHVPELPDQTPLIAAWHASWSHMGWHPVILTDADVPWQSFPPSLRQAHTTNPRQYELACFARWFAMATIPCGGVMTDYDVINQAYTPAHALSLDRPMFEADDVPCAVTGTQRAFKLMCDILTAHIPAPNQHTSDMTVFRANPMLALHRGICKEYNRTGWQSAPLIHFATSSLDNNVQNKSKMILDILTQI